MNKLFILLCLICTGFLFQGKAFAIPDQFTPLVETADAQVKATAGTVYEVDVAYAGVTAGDKIELKNSTDSSGTANLTIIAPAANGTFVYTPPSGLIFTTAIYYDETKSGGTFKTTIKVF